MSELLKPKEVKITDIDGEEKTYIISRFPAIASREILQGYLKAAAPSSNTDYSESQRLMKKLMCYVAAVTSEGTEVLLKTEMLINNHVPDFDVLSKLESQALDYNSDFFKIGKITKSLKQFEEVAKQLNLGTSTHSSEQSLAKGEQH